MTSQKKLFTSVEKDSVINSKTANTIYVRLLGEGTDVWRPVKAKQLNENGFKILKPDELVEDEIWEFGPGSLVQCEVRNSDGVDIVVAVKPMSR